MTTKIAILTSGHAADDDRIYHKIGKSLLKAGYNVQIFSTLPPEHELPDFSPTIQWLQNLSYSGKWRFFKTALDSFNPDIIICCEVFPIHAAWFCKIKQLKKIVIIHDITEWYPENITRNFRGFKKYIKYVLLYLQLISGSILADAFLYGEKRKYLRYHSFAPFKPAIQIGYFPSENHIPAPVNPTDKKITTIGYTGLFSRERGFHRFLALLEKLTGSPLREHFRAVIIGKFISDEEQLYFSNWQMEHPDVLPLKLYQWHDYDGFFKCLGDIDIAIDLRDINEFYSNSLPIKIFDYITAGKPVIFSNLKALHSDINVAEFGFLVDPDDADHIMTALKTYIDNPELLTLHSHNAIRLAQTLYNWEIEEKRLLCFMDRLQKL